MRKDQILLEGIDPALHATGAKFIADGEPHRLLDLMSSHDAIPYVHRHWHTLHQMGRLELFFILGYVMHNTNMRSLHSLRHEIEDILDACDLKRLAASGRGIPEGESFTLYRGGNPDGYSWTATRSVAGKFGAVTSINVNRDDVLFYTQLRNEDEYFIDAEMVQTYRRIA